MTTVLVTGGTGFLGANLVKSLIDKPYLIYVLKRSSSSLTRLEGIGNKIKYFNLDNSIESFFESVTKLDVVIHLATNYGRNNEKEEEVIKSNLDFPSKLLDLSISFNVETFINADTSLPPEVNIYTSTKKKFKSYAQKQVKKSNMKFCNLEIENFFGPNDSEGKFTTLVIKSCLNNSEFINVTEGEQLRDFFHINDLIECVEHLIKNSEKLEKGFYNLPIGLGKVISLKEFCALVKKKTGSRLKINYGAIPYRRNEIMNSVADISHIKKLGWSPRIPLDEAIEMTLRDWEI